VEMESLVTDLISKCYYGRVAGEMPMPRQVTPARAPVA
jgi:hypothetical protein